MDNTFYTPVNIVVGRFQPMTLGHIKCMQELYETTGIKTVLTIVHNTEAKCNKRNPFPTNMLLIMYMNIMRHYECIEGFILVDNADIIKNSEKLKQEGYIINTWTCGTDRYESYKNMVNRYSDKAWITDDFMLIEIPRSDDDVSGTHVRNCINSGNYKEFIKLTPFKDLPKQMSRRYFNMLHQQIKPFYQNDSRNF